MKAIMIAAPLIGAATLIAAASFAQAQQDRYTLKLGQLAFADFKGYEDWGVIAVSQTDAQMKVIVANDVMMKAYRSGLPAKGKMFPEGSKIVKIEWGRKKNAQSPYDVWIPDTLQTVATIEKDSKRFPTTHGWAYGAFDYNAKAKSFTPQGTDAKCGYECHTKVSAQDYIYTGYPGR